MSPDEIREMRQFFANSVNLNEIHSIALELNLDAGKLLPLSGNKIDTVWHSLITEVIKENKVQGLQKIYNRFRLI